MNNFRPIILAEPIILNLNEKENVMSTNNTTEKPKVNIGNLEIEIDVTKASERFIITKKYKGYKLFYKMHRRACTDRLYKGTHFETYEKAKEHFDSFIKTNWKHTKQFQIEPVSNFFISNWTLTVANTDYYEQHDLGSKSKIVLKNNPVSIDDFKRGKELTTVQQLLEKFVKESEKQKAYNESSIIVFQNQLSNIKANIEVTKSKIEDRAKKLANLLQHDSTIAELIEQNTTEAEKTVKLFYGKE